MASALPADDPIEEIATLEDLRRIAAEVRSAKRPRLVSIAGGGEITLAPVKKKRRQMTPEEKAKADREAFLSSIGSWVGHLDDPEEFKRQIKAARGSKRPFVEITLPDDLPE
jgi:hypothetical protein